MISYLSDEHLDPIFAFVAERYGKQEEVPAYRESREGVQKLLGVFERVRMDTYYPSLVDKATYLIIGINKGHFFSNGNKRLALVVMTTFLTLNGRQLRDFSKEEYQNLLCGLFAEHKECTDFPEFTPTDFAMYNLSIVIAESGAYHIEFDVLKSRVHEFLTEALY